MTGIQLDNDAILKALAQLQQSTSDMRPALLEIGEVLTESTKQRFASTLSPDGEPWALNTLATLEHKEGDTPLTGETHNLGNFIDYQLSGSDAVEIGSTEEYAAMMQFGGTKAEFTHLWGDIPARPFLGLSAADETEVLDILAKHLALA